MSRFGNNINVYICKHPVVQDFYKPNIHIDSLNFNSRGSRRELQTRFERKYASE